MNHDYLLQIALLLHSMIKETPTEVQVNQNQSMVANSPEYLSFALFLNYKQQACRGYVLQTD